MGWLCIAALTLGAASGCQESTPDTGLLVVVTFESGLELDQLTFTGDWDGGRLFGPVALPEVADGWLSAEGESVAVNLPAETAGHWIDIGVLGTREGTVVVAGQQSVQVVNRSVVTVVVALQPLSGCGDGYIASATEGCDDGNLTAGDGCSDVCQVEAGYQCVGQPSLCELVACPDGDADQDGVCDSVDACPGQDDRLDEDGDGVPDGCDPCSLDGPDAPGVPLPATGSGITILAASLNGGSNVAVVSPGASFTVAVDYEIEDCGCPACIDQIEVGFVPGPGPLYCPYDGVPGCAGASGSDQTTITAPTTPGEYTLRFGQRQDYSCGSTWWQGEPPPERTLGALCVQ